ncbi:MAG: hypothetical protein FWC26_09645 [Fibromonadales bacterium]|nr:hypothetical protein [Fibromonadales bacterium]
MLESQYSAFYNYLGKFQRLPVEGIFNGEGANGSLPFFVWHNSTKIKVRSKLPKNINSKIEEFI